MASAGRLHISGIPVVLPWSSLIGVAALTWLFAPGFTDTGEPRSSGLVLALVFAVLTYGSILLHELAHAGAARRFGFPVHEIRLYALGGYTTYERRIASPGRELAIALAGPGATLVVAAACWAIGRVLAVSLGAGASATELAVQLAYVGVLLGIYNLLPGLPLDGGALVKSPVWKLTGSEATGTRVAAWSGLVIAAVVFLIPFLLAARLGLDGPDASSTIVVALFSGWLAMGALDALRRSRVESRLPNVGAALLARPVLVVHPSLPLSTALDRLAQLPAGTRLVVTNAAGAPTAIGDTAAMGAVPESRTLWVTCASVSRALTPGHVIPASLEGSDLLGHLADHPTTDYLVVDGSGAIVGVLAMADVQSALTGP